MKAFLDVERSSVSSRRHLLFFLIVFSGIAAHGQTKHYVKHTASGTATGLSWANAAGAAQLRSVIANAASTDTVWVAAGTYYPTASTIQDSAFTLSNGVAVYGGFAGTETALNQRNYTTNVTILSGDIGVLGNAGDNSYHVVVSASNTSTSILDGFTVENGNAIGGGSFTYNGQSSIPEGIGGGILCYSSSPTIANCIFTLNSSLGGGGACVSKTSTATFTNCTFSYNIGTSTTTGQNQGGGGVQIYNCSPSFSGCTFSHNNSKSDGGGFLSENGGAITFSSCTFSTDTATYNGGGIAYENGSSSMVITNSSFTSNITTNATVGDGGGGIYVTNTGVRLTGCTISNNYSASYGGGALNVSGGINTYSTVFSGNNAALYGGAYSNDGNSDSTVNCHFSNNGAQSGGAVYTSQGNSWYMVDTFSNNTATASSGMGGGGMCENTSSASYTISHCWFMGNVTNGSNGAGLYDASAGTDTNTVFQANKAGGSTSNGGGIYHNAQSGSIINCVFVDNTCTGDGGGYYENGTGETLENCTFFNNTAAAGAGIYELGGAGAKYYGNITWGNSPDGFAVGAGATGGLKVKYNDFQAALTFSGGSVTGNINADPQFENSGSYVGVDGLWATADDGLHLKTTSPAVNYDPSNYPGDDIADAIRPYPGNTNASVGAYEGPGSWVTLAIQLLNYTATPAGNNTVDLNWAVDASSEAIQYQVQKSVNGTDFTVTGMVDAAVGRTNYQFSDGNATGAVIYYRLQIIQADGSAGFSATVIVRNTQIQRGDQLSLRPSVAEQGSTTLYIGSPQAASVNVAIVDASGHILSKKAATVSQGDNYIPLDISGFARGIYYVYITGGGGFRKTLTMEKL